MIFLEMNIKKLLSESIVLNKVSHAYLFHGPRGTGKTSTAKIFAKAINCENNIDGIKYKFMYYIDYIEKQKLQEQN